ncbi:MAG: DUF4340 domain-containing protein [Deltaproteobacteria bacterium]|nr:MAG: DUF4340 domain-containing protein [Deltaproteobacteria bacterium]
MLTRFHKILLAVLAVQVVLAVIVLVRGSDSGALKEHPLVPGFDAAKVTRLQVFTSETAKPIDLVKRDASWVLASGFDYPADQTKVNDVLTPITKIAAAAPIASQSSRHKQLKVDKSDYERKLVITADGKDLVLYLGAAAGARRTAVRLGTEDKVYAVTGISAFTAGSEPRQWIDTSYVKIPRDDVARLVVKRESGTMELARSVPPPPAAGSAGSGSAGGVALGGAPIALAAGESVDETAIDRLVGQVIGLELTAPGDPKRDASRPTATITIERKASGSTAPAPTVLDVIADGNSFWVHDRSLSRAAMVDKSRLDELIGADRDKLIKKPPPPPAPMPGAGSGSAAKPPGAPGAAGSAAKPPVPTPPGGPGPGAAAKQPAPTPPGAAAKQPTAPPPSARPATGSAGR